MDGSCVSNRWLLSPCWLEGVTVGGRKVPTTGGEGRANLGGRGEGAETYSSPPEEENEERSI